MCVCARVFVWIYGGHRTTVGVGDLCQVVPGSQTQVIGFGNTFTS